MERVSGVMGRCKRMGMWRSSTKSKLNNLNNCVHIITERRRSLLEVPCAFIVHVSQCVCL